MATVSAQLLRYRRTWRLNRCDNRSRLIDQGFKDDSRHSGAFHVTTSEAHDERSMMRPGVYGPRSLILTMTERLLSRSVTFA